MTGEIVQVQNEKFLFVVIRVYNIIWKSFCPMVQPLLTVLLNVLTITMH